MCSVNLYCFLHLYNIAKTNSPEPPVYNKAVLGIIMCSSLESQAVIGFKNLFLSQSEIAFGDCNGAKDADSF